MGFLKSFFKELKYYPSAIVGLLIIALLIGMALYAVIAIPYHEAITLWRGSSETWYHNPKNAPPAWINYFRSKKLPETIDVDSRQDDERVQREETALSSGKQIFLTYQFDFTADEFPDDVVLYVYPTYAEKQPFVSGEWITPDGEKIRLGNFAVNEGYSFRFTQDKDLARRLKRLLGRELPAEQALFIDTSTLPEDKEAAIENAEPLKGTYTLNLTITTFGENDDVDAELIIYGKVYGIGGTDHLRRDLTVGLLWGTPVAMAFGLISALVIGLATMIIAAIGVWYGGIVDDTIQRLTEINMVLPFLPILIMVGIFISRSLWVIMLVTIALSIFGGGIKSFRAMFLQLRAAPYIEAAQAYGASNARIIFLYLIPRILPMLIPGFISAIPGFVFLEASLAVLGIGDPVLPTWGKIIQDAQGNAALYKGYYYWILEPSILLMVTGLGFALLGFALDRVFNPRLRQE
jgi:peptide/nickel transport system permease protein